MLRATHLRDLVALVLLISALATCWYGGYSAQDLLAEIAILALFAMSLDFIVGLAGLVSLGHALFYGLSAYTVGALTVHLELPPSVAILGGIVVAGLSAAAAGALVVRLSGIFFIMITLAFGQMAWAYFLRSPTFGGYSGMAGIPHVDLSTVGLSLLDPRHIAFCATIVCAAFYVFLARLSDSAFGAALVAVHQNEMRARALGLPVGLYKFAAFVTAGAIAGVAGALTAQRAQFVSPDLLVWTTSGEALIMVIVGGVGTLVGPVIGAILWVLMRHSLSGLTSYWMLFMGIAFVAAVLFVSDGVYGFLKRLIGPRSA